MYLHFIWERELSVIYLNYILNYNFLRRICSNLACVVRLYALYIWFMIYVVLLPCSLFLVSMASLLFIIGCFFVSEKKFLYKFINFWLLITLRFATLSFQLQNIWNRMKIMCKEIDQVLNSNFLNIRLWLVTFFMNTFIQIWVKFFSLNSINFMFFAIVYVSQQNLNTVKEMLYCAFYLSNQENVLFFPIF